MKNIMICSLLMASLTASAAGTVKHDTKSPRGPASRGEAFCATYVGTSDLHKNVSALCDPDKSITVTTQRLATAIPGSPNGDPAYFALCCVQK